MNIPSLKKEVIAGLLNALSLELFHGNQLAITTPVGVIFGLPLLEDDFYKGGDSFPERPDNKLSRTVLWELTEQIATDYKEQHNPDYPLAGNDGFILLKDVTIHSSGGKLLITPILAVFFDQIIGVSIGNPN